MRVSGEKSATRRWSGTRTSCQPRPVPLEHTVFTTDLFALLAHQSKCSTVHQCSLFVLIAVLLSMSHLAHRRNTEMEWTSRGAVE